MTPASSQECIDLEEQHAAHNYHPIPVVFARAKGVKVWDVEGREYIDCLAAYSAANQGHCHPKVLAAVQEQLAKLTISSRAFHSDKLGEYASYITKMFKYDMVLPMNTGAEAVETALKLARKWAYKVKGVKPGEALILSCSGNFHGRTIAVISMSTEPESRDGFEPFLEGVGAVCPKTKNVIRFGDLKSLEAALQAHGPRVAAFLVEPVQGEAGVVVPELGYLAGCHKLCKKYNVLLIADEIQSGLGRTGKLLACDHENVRPEMVLLGKALSGGVYPVSAVLADKEIMLCIKPGEHGSTFGGNPVACAAAIAALQVLVDDGLIENSQILGEYFRSELQKLQKRHPSIELVRGLGLMNAVVLDESRLKNGKTAWDICLAMKERGVLAKPTHQNIIRLTPPLCISKAEIDVCVDALDKSLE
jgi:ornithine--oxo-acid transaminase